MAFTGQIAEIPIGTAGLSGTKNMALIDPGALLIARNLTYENGTVQKEGGTTKYNSTAISGAPSIYGGHDWNHNCSTQRMIVVASDGKIYKDTGGGDYTPTPEGTHLAICNMVVDLGFQETTYMGETKVKHQVYLRWELPHERLEWTDKEGAQHEGPMSIGKTYTLSLSEKANLRKDLETWRAKAFTDKELEGFDLFVLLGIGCQVTVVHAHKDGKTYANVRGIAGWPKGTPKPERTENVPLRYSADENGDFEDLPDWIKERLSKQIDPDTLAGTTNVAHESGNGHDDMYDPIPF